MEIKDDTLDSIWNRTIEVKKRLKGKSSFEEPSKESLHGKWQGRNIIGRDCPINGGVYLGGSEREAIVVDDQKQPELINIYQELKGRGQRRVNSGGSFGKGILSDAYSLTKEVMPFNENRVNNLTKNLKPDQKVTLSSFIIAKAGVCRHQALLCAYLLEKLGKEKLVKGKVSLDRNSIPGMGAHAWVRYASPSGETFIIDPAQNFAGKLENAGKNGWLYKRPSKT